MNFEELQKALEEREFDVIRSIKVKKRTKNMLDKLAKAGVDVGAIIDLALEKIKLEKLVKDVEKKAKYNSENSQLNTQANKDVLDG
ncbi:hypothetical protein [Caminibacter sp.]